MGAMKTYGMYEPNFSPKVKTQSKEDQELAATLVQQFNYLSGLRGNWESHWTEIAQRIYPDHSFLFQNYSQLSQMGDKRNQEIYDATGMMALQRFGAIMDSLLTPRDTFWHQIRANDATIMRDHASRLWFDEVNQILFRQRYNATANFTSQNQSQYLSLGAYGTGAMFIDALAGAKGIRYRNIHLGEIYLQENHQGVVDAVCRRFMLTARQACQQFGENCPEQIHSAMQRAPESQFFFLHWIRPREERDPDRKDSKNMEYGSYYISIEGQKLVGESGYRKFPYSVSRYRQAPNEPYGRGPAMDVLPAIKTLNEQKKTMLKQGHRVVDPVLLAHDDGVIDGFDLTPGAINPGGISSDGRLLVQPLPVGSVQAGIELMQEEQKLINDAFLVTIFQILTETPEMTATEVMERTREKGILLAPTIGRQQSEYLGPMIDRELDILSTQGQLPPMPPMLRSAKGEYKIVYDSPISRTQKAESASGAIRYLEIATNVAAQTGDSSMLDALDAPVVGPEIADILAVPAHWMRSKQSIQAIQEAKMRKQALEQAIQAAPAMAAAAQAQQNLPEQAPQPRQAAPRKGPLGRA